MNPTTHFAFADFARAIENLENTFRNEADRYLLLTGETGVGKTMLCRQLHSALDRCRYRVLYFSHARHLSATGLIRVLAGFLRLPHDALTAKRFRVSFIHFANNPTSC